MNLLCRANPQYSIPLATASVQCVVTSPPYWMLRDYGEPGQIGLEDTPAEYVAHLVAVFQEVRRCLRPDGCVWLNLGDTYNTDTKWGGTSCGLNDHSIDGGYQLIRARRAQSDSGVKAKELVGIPWRVALALQADGWYLRSDNVWYKPNCMPESADDRPTHAHEYVFLLTPGPHYYYDEPAVREPQTGNAHPRGRHYETKAQGIHTKMVKANPSFYAHTEAVELEGGRHWRSVWNIPSAPYYGAHFATFPPALVEKPILASTRPGDWVLDPFNGAGTTGIVARALGRHYVGLDLKMAYLQMSRQRFATTPDRATWGQPLPLPAQDHSDLPLFEAAHD